MRFLQCPKQETLLELVSIPAELSLTKRTVLKAHVRFCADCRKLSESISASFQTYFAPEPEVTQSLLKVYSKLQGDETLILRGWKLNESRQHRGVRYFLFERGWLFRGGLAFGAVALVISLVMTATPGERAEMEMAVTPSAPPPFAQIRIEDKNSVRVHYVKPELLQSSEFETTSAR